VTTERLPADYQAFLQSIKTRVQQAQLKAVVAVNTELIVLYWQIGKQILDRQEKEGWGTKVIDRLSADLHAAFPQMKGFSIRNLKYMRSFAETYPDQQFVQEVLAQITWYHHITLLEKVKDEQERVWYIQQAIEHGWSRNVLWHHIDTGLFHRKGKAVTNFPTTLPALTSDLATNILKDPYVFDFITASDEHKERHVQALLLANIRRFLLELGVGFTFVGSNYHIVVGGEDYYIDLLFYHIRLRCYIVIELKAGSFKPEYVGKLNFYMTAIDREVKTPEDNKTIGIILCKTKNKVTAEYALANIHNPMGVATYRTTEALPEDLQDKLPDIKELEARLEEVPEESEEPQAR
jgi:predicted nuclease of restriction endonuclease-like (RecB) superfamily